MRDFSAAAITLLMTAGLAPAQGDGAGGAPAPEAPSSQPGVVAETVAPAPEQSWLSFRIRARGQHTFRADLDDTDGDVSVSRAGVDAGLAAVLNRQTRLLLNGDLEWSWYDFDADAAFVGGTSDPLDDVYRLRLSPGVAHALNERWTVLGGLIVEIAGETGADIGDSATYGGYAGVRHQFTESFALTVGASVKTRLEEDALVLPFVGFEWAINPRLKLSTEGPGARLTVGIDEAWGVFIGGGWELREYRLDGDGALADGIARDSRAPIELGVEWTPNPRVSIGLSGGVVIWQEYEFDDSSGDKIAEENTDPAPFVSLTGTIRF